MNYAQLREQAERVRQIPLEAVLARLGARPDWQDRSKWHTDQGTLSVTGTKFINWRSRVGGGGAIDLVLHLRRNDFKAAVAWLADNFPGGASHRADDESPATGLRLPKEVPENLVRVRRYLCQERALLPALLEPLIHAGSLYADERGNVVFLLRDGAGRPVGAELRGTTALRWRGLAPGSRKDRGYFSAGPPAVVATPVILCESAIDALSFVTLHPAAHCISTSGVASNPLWLPALLAHSRQVFCAFDSDEVADRHARTMLKLHPTIQRLRPDQHDWNDELCAGRHSALIRL